jgi:hypothetical protein
MNRVECTKQRNYGVSAVTCHLIYAFCFLKTASPTWSSWHAVHSCNCDGKLTVTLQQTFVSGSDFDPDVPFRPLT